MSSWSTPTAKCSATSKSSRKSRSSSKISAASTKRTKKPPPITVIVKVQILPCYSIASNSSINGRAGIASRKDWQRIDLKKIWCFPRRSSTPKKRVWRYWNDLKIWNHIRINESKWSFALCSPYSSEIVWPNLEKHSFYHFILIGYIVYRYKDTKIILVQSESSPQSRTLCIYQRLNGRDSVAVPDDWSMYGS